MRVVFLGAPGAGKGTQAQRLASELGVPHVSTGDMLRTSVESGSELGRKVQGILAAGLLVPDEVMAGVVGERLSAPDCRRGFLLDGYPRTLAQGELLDRLLAASASRLDHVAFFEVPAAELLRRLLSRGRADDTVDTVRRRLEVYAEQTAPLRGLYERRGLLRVVDGTGDPEQVAARLRSSLGAGRP